MDAQFYQHNITWERGEGGGGERRVREEEKGRRDGERGRDLGIPMITSRYRAEAYSPNWGDVEVRVAEKPGLGQ